MRNQHTWSIMELKERDVNPMIDYRLFTFMDLHETMNYTKTAMNLNITQPAVTQHIKYLEQKYQVKLFHYERKHLSLSVEGEYLYQHALSLLANARKLEHDIRHVQDEKENLRLGATLTIGEYLVPQFLISLYETKPYLDLNMRIENTEVLLDEVRVGSIDFALIEGLFDKEEFHTRLLKKEEMILILPSEHPLLDKKIIRIEDLLEYRILVREPGSGTRDVFIQALNQYNLSLHNFSSYMEINHINTIKKLIEGGLGISFLYRSAVKEELADGRLMTRKVRGFRLMREFNMVSLKDSIYNKQYDQYHAFFQQVLHEEEAALKLI